MYKIKTIRINEKYLYAGRFFDMRKKKNDKVCS